MLDTSKNKNKKISIVIVNYNGKKFLKDCLSSLEKNCSSEFEVIIIDNNSSDKSAEYIEDNFSDVTLIKSSVNHGFTGGNNIAAQYATGEYILLLNNDTVVKTSLDPMIEALDKHQDVGAIGCHLEYSDGKHQESIGKKPSPLILALSWTPLAHVFDFFRRTLPSRSAEYFMPFVYATWVSGACLLTRASIWKELKGLDEKYFMYMEDTDYCLRVHDLGYKVAYTSNTCVLHFEGAGKPWIGRNAVLNTTDSYLTYSEKFYGKFGVTLIKIILPPIFIIRSIAHKILHILNIDKYGQEKHEAFFSASSRMIFGKNRK
ncbi:MAG: hypothetical protein RLY71_1376 [Pseudomonadota bacterium]|jgi:GT2 family glycosyltransferase